MVQIKWCYLTSHGPQCAAIFLSVSRTSLWVIMVLASDFVCRDN